VLADQSGLDLVTFSDHPYQPRFFDAWTLLSFVAARTTRIHVSANVLNLRLREPAVLARAVASLDILSGGRAELGIGTGIVGDAAVTMGGRRLTPGQGVDALEEAIDLIRSLWNVQDPSPASFEGRFYHLEQAARGPAPAHDVGLWVGAFKPRMLNLVGRKADGWWPTLAAITPDDLVRGNAAIDEAALEAGRQPTDIRRLLNVTGRGELNGKLSQLVEELARFALEDGVATFVLNGDDRRMIETLAAEVAPAVREIVDAERSRGSGGSSSGNEVEARPATPTIVSTVGARSDQVVSEYDRVGVTPTGTTAPASPPPRPGMNRRVPIGRRLGPTSRTAIEASSSVSSWSTSTTSSGPSSPSCARSWPTSATARSTPPRRDPNSAR
jgi:alkanesulfonate monooxygenase SsuD/methylene tetrahydromethanopterin reductase-like flavin-dependent oxidoreductase (luciferase family)